MSDFWELPILVECPKCSGCGVYRRVTHPNHPGTEASPRFSCSECGYIKTWDRPRAAFDRNRSGPVLGGALWLCEPCCGHELRLLNLPELEYLESYVGATLRERGPDPETGWHNRSYESRLPGWLKSASNRTHVLEALARLRTRVPDWANSRR